MKQTQPSTQVRMLRLDSVRQVTGLSRDSIYRLAREGDFPRPRKLAGRASGWRSDEIDTWIANRPFAGGDAA